MNKPGDLSFSEVDDDRAASGREDVALVNAALSGDSDAFSRIYRKYRGPLFRLAYRMLRNRDLAMDATQEVLIKLYRSLARYDPRGRFFTWAYRIAVNHCIDLLRHQKVRREQSLDGGGAEAASAGALRGGSGSATGGQRPHFPSNPALTLEQREIAERVDGALGLLSEKHRTVFLLYSSEGLSYTEIANLLEIPLGTVMSRLYYARKFIREQLPAEWDPGGRRRREDRRDDRP